MTPHTFHIDLTPADQQRQPYFHVPVAVPPGTTRIDVAMAYPQADDCVIDLGMADPAWGPFPTTAGFRGWSGGARDRFFIATDDATPGYLPGPIPSGTWQVLLGLYRVPARGVRVTLTVGFNDAPRGGFTMPPPPSAVRPGRGWYKGDLHSHTFHSDAAGSPETLHRTATLAGLDLLAVADHNTISQQRYFNPASTPELVFVRAMEVTVAEGHANAYGLPEWVDFRMTAPEHAHVVANRVHELGGLLSINHDKPPIPWTLEVPQIDCMEAWQSAWPMGNEVSLARYDALLRASRRVTAIGGSDYHQPAEIESPGPFGLGRPTTVLRLDELSEPAILAAMQAGRGYITEFPTGPSLVLTAGAIEMGGTAFPVATLTVTMTGAAGDELVIVDATGQRGRWPVDADDARFEIPLAGLSGYVRAEIIANSAAPRLRAELSAALAGTPLAAELDRATDLRRALSNPIYLSTGA